MKLSHLLFLPNVQASHYYVKAFFRGILFAIAVVVLFVMTPLLMFLPFVALILPGIALVCLIAMVIYWLRTHTVKDQVQRQAASMLLRKTLGALLYIAPAAILIVWATASILGAALTL